MLAVHAFCRARGGRAVGPIGAACSLRGRSARDAGRVDREALRRAVLGKPAQR